MKITYNAGEYKQPVGLSMRVKLVKDCPEGGLRMDIGVAVASTPGGRSATVMFWRQVVAAVAWAAEHSPDVRADLAEILRDNGQ